MTKSAEQSFSPAQYKLAVSYSNGKVLWRGEENQFIQKDESKAARLYEEAADRGHMRAQYELAQCYYFGSGVLSSDREARDWYKKAAKQEYIPAQYELGNLYKNHSKNLDKAIRWYSRAVDSSVKYYNDYFTSDDDLMDAWGQSALKLIDFYMEGNGVPEDPQEAFDIFIKSKSALLKIWSGDVPRWLQKVIKLNNPTLEKFCNYYHSYNESFDW